MRYDLVDKLCYEIDAPHSPFETIEASSRNLAKVAYIKE